MGGRVQTVIPQRLAVPSEGVSLRQEPSGRSFSTQPLVEPQRHLQTVTKQVIRDVFVTVYLVPPEAPPTVVQL